VKRGADAHFHVAPAVALRLLDVASGMTRISDATVDQIVRGLTFTSQRHAVLARNLANVATPGYRAQDVLFEDHLRPALDAVGGGAATTPSTRVVTSSDVVPRGDGNDVDVDRQMSRVAQNTLFHSALVQVLIGRFATMKQAISGRV
jgi:flagellar basal-body rod protein FlgB